VKKIIGNKGSADAVGPSPVKEYVIFEKAIAVSVIG